MPMLSLGDMANSFVLRRQNVRLNSDLSRLTQELASGQTADLPKHLRGNYSYLGDIERGLRVLGGYKAAADEAALFTGSMQTALDKIQTSTSVLAPDLIATGNSGLPQAMQSMSSRANGELGALISALNTQVAGRSVFSGTRTDSATMGAADDMLTSLQTAISGETTLSGILAAVDDWFYQPGGGFETTAYLGATEDIAPFSLGDGIRVELGLRGDDPALRAMMKNTAIAALAADPALGLPRDLQAQLFLTAGEAMIDDQSDLTQIRANLGYAEARIEETTTSITAERTAREYARGELLGVDPYETATQLEAVQFQLEALYTATVRVSQLSLVGYLK